MANRQPAAVLALRGSFDKHPERKRQDLPGVGPFNDEPPAGLTAEEQAAWRWLCTRAPLFALTSRDELGMRQCARLKAAADACSPTAAEYKRLDEGIRQWARELYLTAASATKAGTQPRAPSAGFGRFRGRPA